MPQPCTTTTTQGFSIGDTVLRAHAQAIWFVASGLAAIVLTTGGPFQGWLGLGLGLGSYHVVQCNYKKEEILKSDLENT
jgi:hypothetical protein